MDPAYVHQLDVNEPGPPKPRNRTTSVSFILILYFPQSEICQLGSANDGVAIGAR